MIKKLVPSIFLMLSSGVIVSPATAATTYYNYVNAQILDRPNNNYILNSQIFSTDGSPVAVAGANPDGFASAQSTIANNGTATAAASGLSFVYGTESISEVFTTFDFSPTTKGRVTLKTTGWAIANGSGRAQVQTIIRLNNVTLVSRSVASFDSPTFGTPQPGLRKLSLITNVNWKGGDTLSILNFAYAQVYGDHSIFDTISGPGFASAYIDPVIDQSIGSVPEPASWAMLIAGFGLSGAAMRRLRALVPAA
jgi:hypothetical protein